MPKGHTILILVIALIYPSVVSGETIYTDTRVGTWNGVLFVDCVDTSYCSDPDGTGPSTGKYRKKIEDRADAYRNTHPCTGVSAPAYYKQALYYEYQCYVAPDCQIQDSLAWQQGGNGWVCVSNTKDSECNVVTQIVDSSICYGLHSGNFIHNSKYWEAGFFPDGTLIDDTLKNVPFPGWDANGSFESWEMSDGGWQRCNYSSDGRSVCSAPGTERPDWWPAPPDPVEIQQRSIEVIDKLIEKQAGSTPPPTSTVPTNEKESTTNITADGSTVTSIKTTTKNSDGSTTTTTTHTRTNPNGTTDTWTETSTSGTGSGPELVAGLSGVKGAVDGVKGSVEGLRGQVGGIGDQLGQITDILKDEDTSKVPAINQPGYDSEIPAEHLQGPDWDGFYNNVMGSSVIQKIQNSGVTTSDSQCSLTTTVFDKQIELSICQWDYIFIMMGYVVMGIATLYGIFILVARGD